MESHKRINVSAVISALVVLASLAYGYGVLSQKVDNLSLTQQEMKLQLTDIGRKLDLHIGVK